jgi:hypothetical protein
MNTTVATASPGDVPVSKIIRRVYELRANGWLISDVKRWIAVNHPRRLADFNAILRAASNMNNFLRH